MSVAKLLLSGLLVSSGLILGAFTLHGHFASPWEAQANVPRESEREAQLAVLRERNRPQEVETAPDNWAAQLVRGDDQPATADVEAAKARKRALLEKKLAEKRQAQKKDKAKPEEPQTGLPWLWNLIANNGNNSNGSSK